MPTKTPPKAKKAATPKKAADSLTPTEAAVDATIDFPTEGEKIMPGHYAIRITAQPGSEVEISLGGNEWQGCRESIGHYWFDWWAANPGKAELKVRTRTPGGSWTSGAKRTCFVASGGTN